MKELPNDALIIFVKNAVKGQVKTRLAQTVGEDKALQIYLALLDHTRNLACSIDCNRLLFYSNTINQHDDWPSDLFEKHLQNGELLGDKMFHAFQSAFEKQNKKVVIIGSDCASLTTEIIQTAFSKLDQYPFVIGPALDGGYYLLGMKQLSSVVFKNIAWSTDTVLSDTKDRIRSIGAEFFLLPELSDIDYEEDWLKYGWEL